MSTRATYSFQSSGKPTITLYIHHDGYEAGAGHYLAQAFAEGGENRNDYFTVESFIKANDRAEITGSHEAHGDTEYRYDFIAAAPHGTFNLDSTVIVSKRIGFWGDAARWSETFTTQPSS